MAWIESHQELARHPKTRKLARKLDISIPAAVGHLHFVWWWAMDYAEDGDLSRYEAADVAEAAMWEGDPDQFIIALTEAGFLEDDGTIHDWWEYAGRLIDTRRKDAERKRRSRGSQLEVVRTSGGHPADGGRTADVPNPTQPNRTEPDRTEPERGAVAPEAPAVAVAEPEPLKVRKVKDPAEPDRMLITAAFREQMRGEFPEMDEAREYDKATNHTAYRKAIDKRRYYREWLRRAREFAAQNGGNGNGRTTGAKGSTSARSASGAEITAGWERYAASRRKDPAGRAGASAG
jgi:hypothetical protein